MAEVHNTYGGRHTYLLRPDEHGHSEVNKAMYVSPFYPVDGYYDIRVSEPGSSVSVTVALHRDDDPPFVATLRGERGDASNLSVVKASLVYSALRVTILIHWQAARLWWRGLKVQPAMSVVVTEPALHDPADLQRWPALARPRSAPVRAALARVFLRRVAIRTGIRVEATDGSRFGPPDGPIVELHDPKAFFARLGVGGKIGFGESYMAGEWNSTELVEVLEALARHADSLVPRPLQVVRRWYDARQPNSEDNDPWDRRETLCATTTFRTNCSRHFWTHR